MVNPNLVSAIQGDGISTPDELGVQLGDVNVLDDDIANAVLHQQTPAANNTLAANANNRLVGGHGDALQTSLVIGTSGGRVRATPVRVVNGILTGTATGVGIGNAALAVGTLALAAEVVELLVDEDRTRSTVPEPLGQLGDITGRSSSGITAASRARCETNSAASDTGSLCGAQKGNSRNQSLKEGHSMQAVKNNKMTEPAV